MIRKLLERIFKPVGLKRSPKKANKLIDEQIISVANSIGSEFKKESLLMEIAREKLSIQKEQKEFLDKYENGGYENNLDLAETIIDKLTDKYKDLELKIEELAGVRENIKTFDTRNKTKEKEFNEEIELHKIRRDHELEKGYY